MIAEMFRTITGAMFRSLKTILAPLLSGGVWGWALLIFFSSCNLFIEDEEDQNGFKGVPQHTGEGYDAPVTVEQGDATVTYQFNDNVRQLKGEVLKYIKHVEYDQTTALCEVHFDANTPEALLPVPGEILVSNEIETFPMGINHSVQSRYFEDGVYKCLCGFSRLEETFKQLDIDGHLDMGHEEYVSEGELITDEEQDQQTEASRRVSFDVEGVTVTINDDGISLRFPLAPPANFQFSGAKVNPGLEINPEKNYLRLGLGLDFDNFSLSNMKFSMTQEVEVQTNITVKGVADISQKFARFHPLKGKAVLIGPVLLVFFVDIDLGLTIQVNGALNQKAWKHVKKVFDINLTEMKCTPRPTQTIRNEPWTVTGTFSGKFGPYVDFIFAMGIYGKVLSVRIVPSLFFGVEATLPPLSNAVQEAYELVKKSGLDFKLNLELKLGAMINLSLKDLFGVDLRDTKKSLKFIENEAKKDKDLYNKLADAQSSADTKKSDEIGAEVTLGSWDLWNRHWPWFPTIDDKSFKIENIFSYLTEKSTFQGEFKIASEGFLSWAGRDYVPALRITRGKNYQGVIFPEEGGMEARVESGKTYHFKIPATEDNKTYTATPCYFLYPVKENDPEALDKGLNFNATSPSVHIDDVSVVYMKDEFSEEGNIFNDKGQSYRHKYTYHIETRISVYGLENMAFWSVREDRSNTLYRSNRHSAEKQRDGTYIYRWDVTIYANLDDYATKLTFISNAHNKNGDVLKPGNTYVIRCHSSGTYDIVDDGEGFSLSGLKIPEISRE